MNGSAGSDRLTSFARLDEEAEAETSTASSSTGILGGLFGRWMKSSETPSVPRGTAPPPAARQVAENTPADIGPPSPQLSHDSLPEGEGRKLSDRISSLLKSKNVTAGLVDYDRSDHRQYWMPDSTGVACYSCEARFSTVRRRHHCRLCGRIFCSKCCNLRVPGAQFGYTGELRLCNYCDQTVRAYLPERSEGDGQSPSLDPAASPDQPTKPIATVSAGSLHWIHDSPADSSVFSGDHVATETKKQQAIKPWGSDHSILNVHELHMRYEEESGRRRMSSDVVHVEEDESGPDWVRSMNMTSHDYAQQKNNNESWKEDVVKAKSNSSPPAVNTEEDEGSAGRRTLQRVSSIDVKPRKMEGNDLDEAFEKKAGRMLDYFFKREQIVPERWKELITRVSREVASTVTVDVRKRDSMNILKYVHIKKLAVEEDITHAETVWGVVCHQSLTHTEMVSELRDASVMLVGGSIEYERGDRLSSIEPILAQETQFLSKQVERILSRRPSVLMVEKDVSRIASEKLKNAGVRVVLNVKSNVLQRVARSTGADILPSSDTQLIQQNIGYCRVFCQRNVKLRSGREKSLVVLDDCPPDRGCSIILYSRSPRELVAVKRILRSMILQRYSMDLEKAYLGLFNIHLEYRTSACEVCETRSMVIDHEGDKTEFEEALDACVLSVSPFLEVEPPFLETPKGRLSTILPYFKQPLYAYGKEADFKKKKEEEEQDEDNMGDEVDIPSSPRHPFAVSQKVPTFDEVASFRATSGLLFRQRVNNRKKKRPESRSETSRPPDVLDPLLHQRISVLFGSFSPKSPNCPFLCVRPWVVSMNFYADHDMTVGEFLTKFCFNKDYGCPSTNCDVPMLEHSRKLVCGRVCVEVTTQMMGSEETILQSGVINTWHYCPTCKASSPLAVVDSKTWHLSLGKLIDYLAHSSFSLGCASSPGTSPCQHCFFHQHSHFFSCNNFVTTFKVSIIHPYHVLFSPVACRIEPTEVSLQSLIDGVTRMAALASEMAGTARSRLNENRENLAVTYPNVISNIETCLESVDSVLKERLQVNIELKEIEGPIFSNSPVALKANEAVMHIREAAFSLLSAWSTECTAIATAATKTPKKGADENGTAPPVTEVSLQKMEDPFPSFLHLKLKLPRRQGVVVRDLQDPRGTRPDIGSIVAYALASFDYEGCRRNNQGEEVAMNLNASSMGENESTEHLEIEFSDSAASYYVKAYYAERFCLLRRLLLPEGENAFIRSLSESATWTPQGGKSGAHFSRTCDDRFVLKQMSRFEVTSFLKFAPNYFDYIKTAVTEHKLTTLCKVYGVFRVGYKSKTSQMKMDILVMEYLFYKHDVAQVWDLKGSLRNRMASTGKNPSDLVLLDENLMKDLWNNQLYVLPHSKAALNQAISNDSHFLSSHNVMDYSLLVGVDSNGGQLILGIVDYMRTYTLDKKLESWVKIVAIPTAHLPTILSPEMYCSRFSEAIDSYFPVVPDQWTGFGTVSSY